MNNSDNQAEQAEALLDTPDLAEVLDGEQFKQFLDHVPIAIAVSCLKPTERISYVNPEFERLTGVAEARVEGKGWDVAAGSGVGMAEAQDFAAAIVSMDDHIGA